MPEAELVELGIEGQDLKRLQLLMRQLQAPPPPPPPTDGPGPAPAAAQFVGFAGGGGAAAAFRARLAWAGLGHFADALAEEGYEQEEDVRAAP